MFIMLVWMIPYASLNHLYPNSVWSDIIITISQSVICKKWGFIFTVKVTVTEFWFIQWNMTISIIYSELLIFFGDQLSLTVHVHKLEYLVKRLLCCIQGQGHSDGSELQWMFAQTISLIKLSMVMHHHQPKYHCHSEISFCYVQLQAQSHNHLEELLDLQKYWNFCNPD